MSEFRTLEDYGGDVEEMARDKARHIAKVRTVLTGVRSTPATVHVNERGVLFESYVPNPPLNVAVVPRDVTRRMHAAIADILADYLAELEAE